MRLCGRDSTRLDTTEPCCFTTLDAWKTGSLTFCVVSMHFKERVIFVGNYDTLFLHFTTFIGRITRVHNV